MRVVGRCTEWALARRVSHTRTPFRRTQTTPPPTTIIIIINNHDGTLVVDACARSRKAAPRRSRRCVRAVRSLCLRNGRESSHRRCLLQAVRGSSADARRRVPTAMCSHRRVFGLHHTTRLRLRASNTIVNAIKCVFFPLHDMSDVRDLLPVVVVVVCSAPRE